jgi:hypothetical protein
MGCSSNKTTFKVEKPKLNLPFPNQLELDNIKFIVVTKDNFDQVIQKAIQNGQEPVLISLSPNDYKNLSLNIKKIENYLREQRKIIILYKNYYEK